MLDLSGLHDTFFKCASNIRGRFYLNPGEAIVHIDIHKISCVIRRLNLVPRRAQVACLVEPWKEGISADPLEPNVAKRSDHQTVCVVKNPALGRSNTHLAEV